MITLREGLVSAWCPSLDQSRSTRLSDLSGWNNHATLTNMDPGTDWVGGALDFDATNDYCVVPNMPVTGAPFSVSAWFRVNDVTAYRSIFCLAQTGNNTHYFLLQTRGDVAGDPLELQVYAGGGINLRPTGSVMAGQWMHACAVEASTTDHRVYLNGIEATSTTSVAPNASSRCTIGAFYGTVTDGIFNGQLDDIRVWNRALTYSEVMTLRTRRGIGLEPPRPRFIGRKRRSASGNNMLIGCGL